jgi:hypothetical protein
MLMLETTSRSNVRPVERGHISTTSALSGQKVVIMEGKLIAGDGEPPVGGIDICLF